MFDFVIDATDGEARTGSLTTPHGKVTTPVFMPVGTLATVRALSPTDLRAIGTEMVLANAYHLHVRPGDDTVKALGGLHRFMAWDGPILTDSGGFQVFSLEGFREVDDDGVDFQNHVDGGRLRITPERATEIQWQLGADVIMAFDHVVPGDADRALTRDALERTTRWTARCRERHAALQQERPQAQTLWPIVQGGTHADLRLEAARQIMDQGPWTGVAIGGLSVGESKALMYDMLETTVPALPTPLPRYLMGVGFPEDLIEAIARGIDAFDCVAPTRNGRRGTAYTPDGPLNIKRAEYRVADEPLDASCDCETCQEYSRGYLRHLYISDELLSFRLLSLHNVRFLVRLADAARQAIRDARFASWRASWLERYKGDTT